MPDEGAHALTELLPRLGSLAEADIIRPHTDPRAAAGTALLVADWLMQREHEHALAKVGLDAKAPQELARVARAILGVVEMLGGDYLSSTNAIPAELETRGQAVRASTIKELEKTLSHDRDVFLWLEALKRGEGAVDLVYDLRTLAELLTRHSAKIRTSIERLPAILRAASDALEYALRSGEPAELGTARGTLARLWTIFVPAYERAASAARVLSREQGAEQEFPPLALIAAHRRAQRQQQRRSQAPAAPAPTADRPSQTGSRRAQRTVLELEVGIESESNFYVGFTENVSISGVFVATYLLKPIGSRVEVALTMAGGETMRLGGVVRWQRAGSADSWPGMGVQFDALSKEQEARISRFLPLREPIFYDD